MTQTKKYDYQLTQQDATWTAEIVRRVSARKSMVSKAQDGFASEAEAQAWAEQTLQSFMESQQQSNQRRADKRDAKAQRIADKDAKYQQDADE